MPSSIVPKIAVVMPAYFAQRTIAQTLDSVLAQTFVEWSCLVVNDGSTDDTSRIARDFASRDARISLLELPKNGGVSNARNVGFSHLNPRPEFVVFLDSDDLWEPNALALLHEAAMKNPTAVAVHANAYRINSEGQKIDIGELEKWSRDRWYLDGGGIKIARGDEPTTFAMTATASCIITPGVVLIRSEAFARVGGFDVQYKASEDWHLWFRLSRLSDLPFIDTPILAYRMHQSTGPKGRDRAKRNAIVRQAIIQDPANSKEQAVLVRSAYKAYYRKLGWQRLAQGAKDLFGFRIASALKTTANGLVNLGMSLRAPGSSNL